MESKRRGRPPKQVEPEIIEEVNVNTSRDAVLKINLSMPGYEAKDYTITLNNISGKLLSDKKIPDKFIELVESKLHF
jgi:hypothetical protein